MRCPFCLHNETKVIDSRTTEDRQSVRRRRECIKCNKRFTTYERVYELPMMVIKNDGRREIFDCNKIIRGLIRACEKRPVSLQVIEEMAARVEQDMRNTMIKEIPSSMIGEAVINELYGIDKIAYVRFASVYRQFADLERFKEELDRLLKQNKPNV